MISNNNSTKVKVSVIIPTFNREKTLQRAINSVLSQTYQDFELLICDDASTDTTINLALRNQERDSRIRVLCLPYNKGPAAARNLGMLEAKGEYIAFLDSDDEWLPGKLECQVNRMDSEPHEVGVCFCGDRLIKNEDHATLTFSIPDKEWERETFRKYVRGQIKTHTPNVLFRRSCLQKVGMMTPEMRVNEDEEFLFRFLNCFGLAVIPEPHSMIHLLVSSELKKVYLPLNEALPYHLLHKGLIRKRLGIWSAISYECRIRVNVLQAAIRERKWRAAGSHLWYRLCVFPCFFPQEVRYILKALLVSMGGDRLTRAFRSQCVQK